MFKVLNPNYKLILKLIKNQITDDKKITMIDYGCGSGYLLELLPNKWIDKYYGYDVNKFCIRNARRNFNSKTRSFKLISKGKVPDLGIKEKIDVIVMIGVIQYMTSYEIDDFLLKAKKVLRENGVIILSCISDHWIYRVLDLYKYIIPQNYIKRIDLKSKLQQAGYKLSYNRERGFFFSPLFYHCFTIFFDLIDKIIFKTKGILGPVGKIVRKLVAPILDLEYRLPFDYGYTLFIVAKK